MTDWIPCPACGTEHGPEAVSCDVCGFRLAGVDQASPLKCARCGSRLGAGFEFCQICGLRVQSRLPRPSTQSMKLIPRRVLEAPGEGAPEPAAPRAEPSAPARAAEPAPARAAEPAAAPPETITPAAPAQEATGSWGQARVVPAGTSEAPAAEPSREPIGPGDTARMAKAAIEAPEASPMIRAAEAGTSWSAPMARLAVESSRRSSGAAPLRLVLVQRDGSEGDSIPLRGPITIGRKQGEVQFPRDAFISPLHARVEAAPGGGIRLVDLGARNGVFVRISRPEPVFPGDSFLVGHHLLRLENVPSTGREQDIDADGVRLFGTPIQPAWARLTLLGVGGAEAEVHCLRAPQIVFGRELGDIIFPTDPFVSWQHAQLAMELRGDAMTVLLTDLRSANGTYLRIRGDVILQPGDMFRIGDQIFRVRMN